VSLVFEIANAEMKILTVVYSLGKGGTERAAQNFACAYHDIGCDSKVMCTRLDGVRRQYIEGRGIAVFSLQSEEHCEEIKKWNPNVVHLHSHGIHMTDFQKIYLLLPNAKYIETNVFSRPSPWADMIDISYQLSQWCLWLFNKRSNNNYPSAIVPYPVDTAAFARVSDEVRSAFRAKYCLRSSDLVIGRVGQHFDSKWSPVLLDVFEEQRKCDPRVKLLVVNPPDSILRRISESPYESEIIYIKQIYGDENLSACYSSIDLFVLIAEQGESFGMVLAESLLCETSVVTLATPWGDNSQGEVISNRVDGFVAVNKSELSNLIKNLLFDKAKRGEFGRAGRERIIRLFDSKVVAKNSLDIIRGGKKIIDGMSPYQLMMRSEGSIGILSRIILRTENFFPLLFYTFGYKPCYLLPLKLVSILIRRLINLVNVRDA
jgi:glycosyltransferase involved in cell wall biosynthesis